MSNAVMASLNVVVTCIKGHFVDHLFLLGVRSPEIVSQNYREEETSGEVFKF